MAITLTAAYLTELRKGRNQPNIIVEFVLDTGTRKMGMHAGGFSDVQPVVADVTSYQSQIEPDKGYTTNGKIDITIADINVFKTIIADNYLKNRRVNVKSGFVAPGFLYSDYATVFSGKITDYKISHHQIKLTASDDLYDAKRKFPVENTDKTQLARFSNMNPVDIMTKILGNSSYMALSTTLWDQAQFNAERDLWLSNWRFERYLTNPQSAIDLLSELQIETNSFIFNNGNKISFKVFSPATPGQVLQEWSGQNNLLEDSVVVKPGYNAGFYNRVIVYYDYTESGGDSEQDYESAVIAIDAGSQASTAWNETNTKVIKSKWMKTCSPGQATTASTAALLAYTTIVKVYHASKANGSGNAEMRYNGTNKTMEYKAPAGSSGAYGDPVEITGVGEYQVYDADTTKWLRFMLTSTAIATTATTAIVPITGMTGSIFAEALATKFIARYGNPVTNIFFDVDLNEVAYNSNYIQPTDYKLITSDLITDKGRSTWLNEEVMLTSVRPDWDKGKIEIEAIQTRHYKRYGFIASTGFPDYGSAASSHKQYGYIGTSSNEVLGATTEDGYYIW